MLLFPQVSLKNSRQIKLYSYYNTSDEEAKVFLWDSCRLLNFEHVHGTDMDSLMEHILNSHADYFYIHNLERYAGAIFYWLDKDDWMMRELPESTPQSYRYDSVISGDHKIYSINLYYMCNTNVKNYRRITIYDSMKKVPMHEEALFESSTPPDLYDRYKMYLKTYPYECDDIGVMGYPDFKCAEFWSELVAGVMQTIISQNMKMVTIGTDAVSLFKNEVIRRYEAGTFKSGFPKLSAEEDEFCRMAYKGGLVLVDDKALGRDVGKGLVIDVNQMYPYWASYGKLPYDRPKRFEGKYVDDEEYPLFFQQVVVDARLKPGFIPYINDEDLFVWPGFGQYDLCDANLVLTRPDMEMLEMSYDIETINYIGGYAFKAIDDDANPFRDFFKHYYQIKISTSGYEKLVAKLINNSLIGKFASMKYRGSYTPKVGDLVEYEYNDVVTDAPFSYVPVAAYTNAYARKYLALGAHYNIDRFLYCDTDSLHLEGDELPVGVHINDTEMGAYKLERVFDNARYLSKKTYIHKWSEDGKEKIKVCCSGLTLSGKKNCTWENFVPGGQIPGNLRRHPVKGGSRMVSYTYNLPK